MARQKRPLWWRFLLVLIGSLALYLGYIMAGGMNSYDLYEVVFFTAAFLSLMIAGSYLISRGLFGI